MILKLNENDIEKCDCIFIQAPGFNKGILIGENKPLFKYKKNCLICLSICLRLIILIYALLLKN